MPTVTSKSLTGNIEGICHQIVDKIEKWKHSRDEHKQLLNATTKTSMAAKQIRLRQVGKIINCDPLICGMPVYQDTTNTTISDFMALFHMYNDQMNVMI